MVQGSGTVSRGQKQRFRATSGTQVERTWEQEGTSLRVCPTAAPLRGLPKLVRESKSSMHRGVVVEEVTGQSGGGKKEKVECIHYQFCGPSNMHPVNLSPLPV